MSPQVTAMIKMYETVINSVPLAQRPPIAVEIKAVLDRWAIGHPLIDK